MLYVIGLAIASLLGIFGFIFSSKQKEDHDKRQQNQAENLYGSQNSKSQRSAPPFLHTQQAQKLSGPLAIFGILGSLIISVFGAIFFFRGSKQQRRNQSTQRINQPRPNSRRSNPYPYQQQIQQVPRRVQRQLPQQIQRINPVRKKKNWWWPF